MPDFFSRTYNVHLAPIDEAARLTEDELWAAFEEARPRLLGAIYDTLSLGPAPVRRGEGRRRSADPAR